MHMKLLLSSLVLAFALFASPLAAQAGDYSIEDNSGNNHPLNLEEGGTGGLGMLDIQWGVIGDDIIVYEPVSEVIFILVGAAGGGGNTGVVTSGGANQGTWERGVG